MIEENKIEFHENNSCDSCNLCNTCNLCNNSTDENKYINSTAKDCKRSVLCNEAAISECEAQLFCDATARISCELRRCKNLQDLKVIFNMINCLFTSSAEKEKALAEVINAYNNCHPNNDHGNCDCK